MISGMILNLLQVCNSIDNCGGGGEGCSGVGAGCGGGGCCEWMDGSIYTHIHLSELKFLTLKKNEQYVITRL